MKVDHIFLHRKRVTQKTVAALQLDLSPAHQRATTERYVCSPNSFRFDPLFLSSTFANFQRIASELAFAAERGHITIVQALLQTDAVININNESVSLQG